MKLLVVVTFGTARMVLGGAAVHSSTASVQITVLPYNGPLPIRMCTSAETQHSSALKTCP